MVSKKLSSIKWKIQMQEKEKKKFQGRPEIGDVLTKNKKQNKKYFKRTDKEQKKQIMIRSDPNQLLSSS